MQITAKLKSKQQLMSLPTFEREYNDKLWFEDFFVSEYMLNKGTLELHWNKEFKSLSDDENYIYNLDWLDTLTFTDNRNRFSFELRIDGLEVTVKTLHIVDKFKFSYKKCELSGDEKLTTLIIKDYVVLGLKDPTDSYTFKSHKALTKFIGRLCRVKELI